ncbi:hypothetical protein BC830DRAFT_1100139 [Chytriomyces sp. MP71]|nr:hypothetical protein BC830DRAFT_1100139 [Chytriomyces sp. MP71]
MRVHGAEEDVEAVSRPHCGDTLPVPTVESNLGLQILEDSATATAALQYLHMILDENQSPCAVQNSAWALADSIHHSALSRVGLDTSSSSLLDAGKLARITMEHLVHVDVAGSHSQRANVALKLITQLPGWNLELVQQLVHKHINLESILQDVSWMHPLEVQMTPMQLFGLEIWKARDANASVGFSHHEYDKYLFCINEVLLLRGFVSVPVGARRRGHERFMYLDVCITSMPKYVDDTELSTLCACRYCDEHQEKSSGFRGLESIASEVVELLKSQFHFTCAHESEKEGRVLGFLRFKDFRIGIDIKFRHLHQLAVTIFHWTGPPEFVSRIIVYAMEFKRARIEGDCVIVDKEIVFPRSERELFETILSMEYPAPHERV